MDTNQIDHDLTGFPQHQSNEEQTPGINLHSVMSDELKAVIDKPGLDQISTFDEFLNTLDENLKSLLSKKREQSERIFNNAIEGKIIEIPVLMYQGETPFIILNGVHTVFANPKQGKSVLLNTITAAALLENGAGTGNELLELKISEEYKRKIRVLIFDTEQGERKATQRLSIIFNAIGFNKETPPPMGTIEVISLRNEINKDRLIILENFLKAYSILYADSNFLVFLDTITDFTNNFNDLDETVLFWEKLLFMSESFRTTFINTMHKSKNGSSLGHMGTYAEKKSEVIWDMIKKRNPNGKGNPPTYELYVKDTRNFADSDEPIRMKYNSEIHLYRLVNEDEQTEIRQSESSISIIQQLFNSFEFSSFTVLTTDKTKGERTIINPKLIEIFGDLQRNTIDRRLNKLCESEPVKVESNLLRIQLHKKKIGNKNAFEIRESIFQSEVSGEQISNE